MMVCFRGQLSTVHSNPAKTYLIPFYSLLYLLSRPERQWKRSSTLPTWNKQINTWKKQKQKQIKHDDPSVERQPYISWR